MSLGPLQTNATVTRVTDATAAMGGLDDWDSAPAEPATSGAAKWTGSEPAYLKVETVREQGPDGVNVLVRRTLIVQAATARLMAVDTDDVITFTGPDGTQATATTSAISISELAGVDPRLQTARLELQPT